MPKSINCVEQQITFDYVKLNWLKDFELLWKLITLSKLENK